MINQLKKWSSNIFSLFFWLLPLIIFLISTCLPKFIWNISFENYLMFLKIIVWPYTVLVILFFFKKVVTYLFFSMDGFNFFGVKGELKNVSDVILQEVNKKFLEREGEEKRTKDMVELNQKIKEKEEDLKNVTEKKEEHLKLAKAIMSEWKKSTGEQDKIIRDLEAKCKKLREGFLNLPQRYAREDSSVSTLENQTSDSIQKEENN